MSSAGGGPWKMTRKVWSDRMSDRSSPRTENSCKLRSSSKTDNSCKLRSSPKTDNSCKLKSSSKTDNSCKLRSSSKTENSCKLRYCHLRSKFRNMVISRNFGLPIPQKVTYENSYKLGPEEDQRFSIEECQQMIYSTLETHLAGKNYDQDSFPSLSKTLADVIKDRVKSSGLTRYKIVAYVTVVEKRDQQVNHSSRCLWDPEKDNYASAAYETPTFYAVGNVFATYYE